MIEFRRQRDHPTRAGTVAATGRDSVGLGYRVDIRDVTLDTSQSHVTKRQTRPRTVKVVLYRSRTVKVVFVVLLRIPFRYISYTAETKQENR